jgi:hypothetical protein
MDHHEMAGIMQWNRYSCRTGIGKHRILDKTFERTKVRIEPAASALWYKVPKPM